MDDFWVIIPAYNEEKNVVKVIKGVRKHTENIVVVDDGSKDDTYNVAKKSGVIVLKHIINLGKGAALKTGCDYILERKKAHKILFIDSDGQHDPKEIPRFIDELNRTDIIFGTRKFDENMPLIFKLGNTIINVATRLLYNINLKDSLCGYRAFRAGIYKKIRWDASGYSVESEIIAKVGKNNLKYKEIPIDTIYSDKYKGTTILDGIKIVIDLIFWRLRG